MAERPPRSPLQQAVGLLSRREHSQKELRRKLAQRGVEPEAVDAALTRLGAAGLQDDARFAGSLLRNRCEGGYGPLRIRAELAQHGLGSDLVESVLAESEVDWRQRARELVDRRFPELRAGDGARWRKAQEFLLRRGFSLDDARAATADSGQD